MMKKLIETAVIVVGCSVLAVSAQQPQNPFGAQQFDLQGLEGIEEIIQQLQQAFDGQQIDLGRALQGFGAAGLPQAGPRTYLGARLVPVSPEVAHHLDLPSGFYQTVKGVQSGSPAEKAGLEAFDIITHVDDQKIINAQQLVQLVSAKHAGDIIALTILRKGKEKKLEATLEETAGHVPQLGGAAGQLGDLTEMMRLLQEGFGQLQQPPAQPRPQGGRTQPDIIVEEDAHGNRTTRSRSSSRSSMMHTDQGQFKFSEENGNKQFKVTDPDGNVVFDGAVNSKQDRSQVPPEYREQLDSMDQGKGPALPKHPQPRTPAKPKKKLAI
jgi:hypothetical protein